MARRNIEKTLARGRELTEKNPAQASLNCIEFYEIANGTDSKLEASYNAYLVGLAIGERIGKKERATV